MLRDLGGDGPADDSPAVHYSVDLSFRFLPDLVRHARAASERDALVGRLMDWANRWPLSCVGFAGAAAGSIDGFAGHPCLLRMYVDRIIAGHDVSRLTDQRVRGGRSVGDAYGATRNSTQRFKQTIDKLSRLVTSCAVADGCRHV
jgi:hypothetical protein